MLKLKGKTKLKTTNSRSHRPEKFSPKKDFTNSIDFSNFRLNDTDIMSMSENRANNAIDTIFKLSVYGKTEYVSLIAVYGVDIMHFTEPDMIKAFNNFGYTTKLIDLPHKYVFTYKTPDLKKQKEFLKYKLSKASNMFVAAHLRNKINQLEHFEKYHNGRLAYLMIFSKDIEKLYDSVENYCNAISCSNIVVCNNNSTIGFLKNLLSFSDETIIEETSYDYNKLNEIILPERIEFQQSYTKVNETYVSPIVVYSYPALLSPLTITKLVAQNYDDILATWDIGSVDKQQIINELKNSMKELESRHVINEDIGDKMDTNTEFEKLQIIYDSIVNGSEQMLYTTLRFYVYGKDIDKLRKKVKSFMKQLEADGGLMSFVATNEMPTEYIKLCTENNTMKTPLPLYDTFAKQYPFYYQEHIDKTGLYFGNTQTDGLVILNTFTRNKVRPSYDLLALGLKGGGKSVTLKTMVQDQLLLDNKVMALDPEGEYSEMAKAFAGQVIKMNKQSTINPLQIMNTVVADRENITDTLTEENEKQNYINSKLEAIDTNFTSEISRICTFLSQFAPNLDHETIEVFREILLETYSEKGIDKTTDTSTYSATDFPVISDVVNCIAKHKHSAKTNNEIDLLTKLNRSVNALSKDGAYGSMFDNYTNVEIENNNLIIFDVRIISEMDENVYNAQLFNIMSLMWSEICKNVAHNNDLINPYDRRNVICLIDEAHRFISTKNTLCTDFILKLVRRSRKYDAALWFATQSILDFMPSDNSGDSDTVRKIFQLVQYKVLLKQSTDSIDLLHTIFPQFTLSELQSTDNFEAGEMLLALSSGNNKVHCRRIATDCDLLYVGNSQDRQEIIYKIFNRMYLMNWNAEELALRISENEKSRNHFVDTFTIEILNYFGFSSEDSKYLHTLIHRLVQNLTTDFVTKQLTS